jgi:hypothetical protein
MNSGNWRHRALKGLDAISALSRAIRDMEAQGEIALPNLRRGPEVIVASDYGSDNRSADFKLMSFLFVLAPDIPAWSQRIETEHEVASAIARRVPQYKNLKDEWAVVDAGPWLLAAEEFDGLLFSFAIPTTQLNIFTGDKPFDKAHPDVQRWQHWNRDVLLRALTACHIIGMVTRGLAAFHQRVTWITDRDSIAANPGREQELGDLFRGVMRLYTEYRPDQSVNCYTPGNYADPRIAERLLVIPDLATGVLTKALTIQMQGKPAITANWDNVESVVLTGKDRALYWWLGHFGGSLKRLIIAMSLPESSKGMYFVSIRWAIPS